MTPTDNRGIFIDAHRWAKHIFFLTDPGHVPRQNQVSEVSYQTFGYAMQLITQLLDFGV